MNLKKGTEIEGNSSAVSKLIQTELERKLFHLKTLYDVSREMLGTVEVQEILKNFLLMTTGNFGVIEGFLLILELPSTEVSYFDCVGFEKEEHPKLLEGGKQILSHRVGLGIILDRPAFETHGITPPSVVCALPFEVDDSCSGLLGLGGKIVGEPYSDEDKELFMTLVNNLVITLKNARHAKALQEAYAEMSSLNRAKDKAINHLSHELKTPIALVKGCLNIMRNNLGPFPEEKWKRPLNRAGWNLDRLVEIQTEVEDIMKGKALKTSQFLNLLLKQCTDVLEIFVAEETGKTTIAERVRKRIEEIFASQESTIEDIQLDRFVEETSTEMRSLFLHRDIELVSSLDPTPVVKMPRDPLKKIVKGLTKNAIENTPDEGKVEVNVQRKPDGVLLVVRDTGVGIVKEYQKRIFEGFFPTQETISYSSKHPFDFNAGGKGSDLLRMKIFSERYGFKLDMTSSRCRFIPEVGDECPGRISLCKHCSIVEDCYHSGGTSFEVFFPQGAGRQ